MNFLAIFTRPKPVPIRARMPRTAPRAQRRTRDEREAFEATTRRLRAEVTERALVAAVSRAILPGER